MTLLPLLWVTLSGCEGPEGSPCQSGVRETFITTVDTQAGPVDVETTQCVSTRWEFARCDQTDLAHCWYFFEPYTPPKVPLELIFDDYVFRHAIGDVYTQPPADLPDSPDLQTALMALSDERVAEGYRATPVTPITMLGGYPAFKLTVSCDDPDLNPLCPFTWQYTLVDLDALAPGLYADFSSQYAQFVDAGNAASALPEEFAAHAEMMDSIELISPNAP